MHKLAILARNLVQFPRLIQVEPALGPLDMFEPAQLRFGGGRLDASNLCECADPKFIG